MSTNDREAFAALVKAKPNWLAMPMEKLVQVRGIGDVYTKTRKLWVKEIARKGYDEQTQERLFGKNREAILADGQQAGETLLEIEAAIGELLPTAEEAKAEGAKTGPKVRDGLISRKSKKEITRETHARHRARAIAGNPKAVEAVIREAKANDDIPTPTAVLNKVNAERQERLAKKLREKLRKQTHKPKAAPDFSDHLAACIQRQTETNAVLDMIPKDISALTESDARKLATLAKLIADAVRCLQSKKEDARCRLLTAKL